MKKILVLCAMVLFLGMAVNANAVTVYTDTYNANAHYMSGSWWPSGLDDTISWTFDITDDGYNPSTESVVGADITLNFTDDGGWFDWTEYADLTVGSNVFFWEVDTGDVSFTLTSLMTLSGTGTVNASLTATAGDFYFNSATLTANAVPEPGTLFLLGTGFLGLVGLGYRRKKGKV